MYNTNNYKVHFSLYYELERYCREVDINLKNIDDEFHSRKIKLKEQKEEASRQKDFHEESYDQHYYDPDLIEIEIAKNDRLVLQLKDVFSKFECSLRELVIRFSSVEDMKQYKRKYSSLSNIQVYKQFVTDRQNINLSEVEPLWDKIDKCRTDVRCVYEHEGNNFIKSSEELKNDITEMKKAVFGYLDYLMKQLYKSEAKN
mgnify:FL=1